jgi:hypothetical protein
MKVALRNDGSDCPAWHAVAKTTKECGCIGVWSLCGIWFNATRVMDISNINIDSICLGCSQKMALGEKGEEEKDDRSL